MRKFLLLASLTLLPVRALAWDQSPNKPIELCIGELPYGVPKLEKPNTVIRCNTGYALQHDNDARIAAWAGWTVVPDESIGCVPREDAFTADQSIPKGQRAEVNDYSKSGYDKGHMVPDADMSYSKQTSLESFLMSNMSPQLPNLNRGAWKQLEAMTRTWAWGRKHSITVYSGNVYKVGVSKTIGENKVVVPDALFKIVIDNVTGEVMAFTFPHIEKQPTELKPRLSSVGAIERATGISFPLPSGADKSAIAPDVWPGDQGDMMSAKKLTCKVKK